MQGAERDACRPLPRLQDHASQLVEELALPELVTEQAGLLELLSTFTRPPAVQRARSGTPDLDSGGAEVRVREPEHADKGAAWPVPPASAQGGGSHAAPARQVTQAPQPTEARAPSDLAAARSETNHNTTERRRSRSRSRQRSRRSRSHSRRRRSDSRDRRRRSRSHSRRRRSDSRDRRRRSSSRGGRRRRSSRGGRRRSSSRGGWRRSRSCSRWR